MIEILIQLIILIVSLAILTKSADLFTDFSYKIGVKLKMSDFVIGVIILSIGTSLPELGVTLISSLKGESEIVLGNILGSNISNILLILGLSFIFAKTRKITKDLKDTDLPLYLMISLLLLGLSIDKVLTKLDGALLITSFIIYMLYARSTKKEIRVDKKMNNKHVMLYSLGSVVTLCLIFLSSKYTVDSLVRLSNYLKIEKSIISALLLAIGTSLPELFVSLSAARKGLLEVSLGNVIGSNIFNVSFILGSGALINNISYDKISFFILLPSLILSTFVVLEIFETKNITRYEGGLMVLLFIAYVLLLISYM